MSKIEVELFASNANASVIRLPERRFPGVVIQGDSLKVMLDTAREISRLSINSPVSELKDCASELEALLAGYLEVYENSLRNQNWPLPYEKK